MSELINFPIKNQLTTTLDDGTPDPNGSFDCVAESIAACLQWLTGKAYEGGVLKEAVYGKAYQGSTDAERYIDYCATQGVTLSMVECESNAAAISRAHWYIHQNIPVIFTQQDDYAPLMYRNEWTHVCTFHAESPGSLTAMDTFIAQNITYSDEVWVGRLRSTQLWILEKTPVAPQKEEDIVIPSINLSNAVVASYFEQDGTQWRCKQTGKHLGNDILTFYQLLGSGALCGLTYAGLPLTDEISIGNGRTLQFFERLVLAYDPDHTYDSPPGAGAVYPVHLYSGRGQDPRLATAQKQVATLQAQVSDVQKQLDAAKAELAKPAQPDVALQAQLAQAQSRLAQIEELAKV